MLTRTVSRRRWRWRAALQGARGEWGKRAEADEKRAEAEGVDGERRRGGRLLRLAGAGRKPDAMAGPWEGTVEEAREAMGRGVEAQSRPFPSSSAIGLQVASE
jgi:hypothetical protein